MNIPYIRNYNSLRFSGCSFKYAKRYGRDRIYGPVLEYGLTIIPITSLFGFVWKNDFGYLTNYPITHSFQHLSADENIDIQSFISLN